MALFLFLSILLLLLKRTSRRASNEKPKESRLFSKRSAARHPEKVLSVRRNIAYLVRTEVFLAWDFCASTWDFGERA
jgi:hypothetical protein